MGKNSEICELGDIRTYMAHTHIFFDTNFSLKCSIAFNSECRQQTTTVSVLHACDFCALVISKNQIAYHIKVAIGYLKIFVS